MKMFPFIALLCLLFATLPQASAAIFNVANANDAGLGSLRWAITQANGAAGPDVINFNIPPGGPQTIALASPLPVVAGVVTIDGTTQPGWAGTPIIELNGAAAGAGANGLTVTAGGCHILGLVINRFAGHGISLDTGGGSIIEGNYIGTDPAGAVAQPNNLNGILIFNSANNVIGGTTGPQRNVISGNNQNGLRIETAASSGNQVFGNLIGTDAGGMGPLGNALNGVSILGAPNNQIGLPVAGARNAIGDNGASGLRIDGVNATGNQVRNNSIGTDPFGLLLNLGNALHGVHLVNNASGNAIGGIAAADVNAIFFNQNDGIFVQSGVNNPIRHNPIGSNGALGIDLAPNNPTLNDACDGDAGPNTLQNYPLPTAAIRDPGAGATQVIGTLDSAPNAAYAIDFFWSLACDPSGYGEGEVYFGSVLVMTGNNCLGAFNVVFPGVLIPAGVVVTATATDATGNTSEFSPCLPAITGVVVVDDNPDLNAAMVGPAAAVFVGADAAFSITINNLDEGVATGVVVNNPIPAGLTFVSAGIDGDTNRTCHLENNVVVCNLGEMSNAPVTISLVLRANELPGQEPITVINVATVSAREVDPDLANNVAEARVQIQPLPPRRDFGDAPPPYPTRLPDGARHRISNLYLGSLVDSESDGQPRPGGTGDDQSGSGDDEDGIVFGPLVSGGMATVTATSSGVGRLDAWADFNRNGVWDSTEQIFLGQELLYGVNSLTFAVPAGLSGDYVWFRFRLSSAGGLAPGGEATDGEIEDYRAFVRPASIGRPRLEISQSGTARILTWDTPSAALEQADLLTGAWTPIRDAVSPFTVPGDNPKKFYRLRLREDGTDFAEMAREADLIFEGVVTSVEYRNSSTDQEHQLALPHTFVTFRNERIFKGRLTGPTVTLRFIGGPTPDGAKILQTSRSTLFDVGERSILFVSGNGQSWSPLVDCPEGRFRVIDDYIVTEDGQEVLWTEEARVAFGSYRAFPEVVSNRIGNVQLNRVRTQQSSEFAPVAAPVGGQPMSKARFGDFLDWLISRVHSPHELAGVPVTPSLNSGTPFTIANLKPGQPRPPVTYPASPAVETPAELQERLRFEANDFNPVLP